MHQVTLGFDEVVDRCSAAEAGGRGGIPVHAFPLASGLDSLSLLAPLKALLLTAPSQLALVDFPDPSPAKGEVLLRVRACGICGSDIHGWDGSTGRRRPPLIMGHEASGEIAEVGSGVKDMKVGDRVTFDSMISCCNCFFCHRVQMHHCGTRMLVGALPRDA